MDKASVDEQMALRPRNPSWLADSATTFSGRTMGNSPPVERVDREVFGGIWRPVASGMEVFPPLRAIATGLQPDLVRPSAHFDVVVAARLATLSGAHLIRSHRDGHVH